MTRNFVLPFVALLLGAVSARAQPQFDYFLLSLSVAPSFCASSARNAAQAECRRLTADGFARMPLTLHGLWPNRARVSVNRQPQECGETPLRLSASVRDELAVVMPAGPGLARYEWRKHGTCSGLDADAYFATAARWTRAVNAAIGPALLDDTVRLEALRERAGRADPALADAIVMDCRFRRGAGEALLEEIRVTLDHAFRPIPAASVGLGQNSGCPGGSGRIPRAQ